MAIELHHINTHGMMEQAGKVLDGVVRLKARIVELEKENAELKEAQRWRKCSESMPEEDNCVLFSDGIYIYLGSWTTWDGGCSDYSYEIESGWVESGGREKDFEFDEIKYWMPLPKPWRTSNENAHAVAEEAVVRHD